MQGGTSHDESTTVQAFLDRVSSHEANAFVNIHPGLALSHDILTWPKTANNHEMRIAPKLLTSLCQPLPSLDACLACSLKAAWRLLHIPSHA